jgi:hypothetical protein
MRVSSMGGSDRTDANKLRSAAIRGGMSTLGQSVSTSDTFTGHLSVAESVGPEGTIT